MSVRIYKEKKHIKIIQAHYSTLEKKLPPQIFIRQKKKKPHSSSKQKRYFHFDAFLKNEFLSFFKKSVSYQKAVWTLMSAGWCRELESLRCTPGTDVTPHVNWTEKSGSSSPAPQISLVRPGLTDEVSQPQKTPRETYSCWMAWMAGGAADLWPHSRRGSRAQS